MGGDEGVRLSEPGEALEREGEGVDRLGITYGENRVGCGAP